MEPPPRPTSLDPHAIDKNEREKNKGEYENGVGEPPVEPVRDIHATDEGGEAKNSEEKMLPEEEVLIAKPLHGNDITARVDHDDTRYHQQ